MATLFTENPVVDSEYFNHNRAQFNWTPESKDENVNPVKQLSEMEAL